MKSCLGRKNFIVVGVLMALLGLVVGVAKCDTIIVRADGTGDYPTIQTAIDASIDGDIVLVADGIYTGDGNRDIDFLGKAITVRSENGPENCIIDCQGSWKYVHRGFDFHSGEDANSVLEGFTIKNGLHILGGAIRCNQSSPTITNCTFSGNWAWEGAGVANYNASSPKLTNCRFGGNSGGQGGGMYNRDYSSPTLTNCTFSENLAEEMPSGLVDVNIRHQVIEGFGANGAFYENWLYAHPKKSQIYDKMFGQLGLDIYRIRNVYHIDTPWNSWQQLMSMNAEAVKKAANSLGHPIKVIISAWTPPTYLKSNGNVARGTLARYPGGGYMYPEYAEWWTDSIREYTRRGVTADYITIQNEPTWEAPYDSCKFKPTETTNWAGYNLALNAVYQELASKMPSPPAILAPDTLSLWKAGPFIDAILDKSQVYGYAHHPYGDGNFDNPDSFIPGMRNFAATYNDKPIFQTEYCRLAGDGGFNEVINLARHIHNGIVHEGVTAYFFWNLFSAASDVSKGLITIDFPWQPNPGYTVNHRYYAFKQYSKFTEPGWQRVEASTNSGDLRICAFISEDDSELTVVIINVSNTTMDFALSLGDFFADSRKIYRTSATERTKYIGDFPASQLLPLPAKSITTVALMGAITSDFDTTNWGLYNGGGIYNDQSSPRLANCILWGNTPEQIYGSAVVTYSDVQGGWPGEGNIDADPCFVDLESEDYGLLPTSPCIDAGDNTAVPADTTDLDGDGDTTEPIPWDLDGGCRFVDNPNALDTGNGTPPIVDMGAYEFAPAIEMPMHFTPQALNPDSKGRWLKAHFVLPEGFVVEDVDVNVPATLEPVGIESDYINVFADKGRFGEVGVEIGFDRAAICGAGIDYGPAEVTVTGRLISCEYFYGTDTIRIITNNLKYLAVLASHWLEADCGVPDWCGGVDLDRNSVVDFVDFVLLDGCCIEVIKE